MIYPLKDNWHVNEDVGFVPDQIKDRVNSESNYCWSKGYPNIKSEDIKTKKVKQLLVNIEKIYVSI